MIIIDLFIRRPNKKNEKSSSKTYFVPSKADRDRSQTELEEALKGSPFTRPMPGREILN